MIAICKGIKKVLYIIFIVSLTGNFLYSQTGKENLKRFTRDELKQKGWEPEKFKKANRHADTTGTASYLLIKDGKIIDSYGDITHNYRCHSIRKLFECFVWYLY